MSNLFFIDKHTKKVINAKFIIAMYLENKKVFLLLLV